LKKISSKGKIILRIDKLLREILLIERGSSCEWCGKRTKVFMAHILPKGTYPRLRYAEENILLLCYYCHMIKWHRNPLEAHKFMMELRGPNYDADLMKINGFMDQHSMFYLLKLERYMRDRYNNLFSGAVVIQRRPVC
jgi:hypothetical protein